MILMDWTRVFDVAQYSLVQVEKEKYIENRQLNGSCWILLDICANYWADKTVRYYETLYRCCMCDNLEPVSVETTLHRVFGYVVEQCGHSLDTISTPKTDRERCAETVHLITQFPQYKGLLPCEDYNKDGENLRVVECFLICCKLIEQLCNSSNHLVDVCQQAIATINESGQYSTCEKEQKKINNTINSAIASVVAAGDKFFYVE